MDLQRSKYLSIDTNISKDAIYDGPRANQFNKKLEATANPLDPNTGKPISKEFPTVKDTQQDLSLKYCLQDEVARKRTRITVIKA